MYNFTETTPSELPVDLDTVKNVIQMDGYTYDDAQITSYVGAATSTVEHMTGRALVSRSCTMTLSYFPHWFQNFRLYKVPIMSVDSVSYTDTTGTSQILDPSFYQFASDGRFGAAPRKQFPPILHGSYDAVTINYTSGYGDAAAVPPGLQNAIMFLTRHWYIHRTNVSDVQNYQVPMTVDAMLMPFMVASYA